MPSYADGLREGFNYLMENYREVFVIGQGLWSPWYVGSSMTDLDKKFGKARVIDTPVCEAATTGVAIGASLCGYRPIVVHPRMDFMILATDQIVNQAAKWNHMLGGQMSPRVTIRGIVNRGGEQGAQHSQALHSWYAHIPGLRVVMPATPVDARNLLIASTLCDDPVLFIDDRWCYEWEAPFGPIDLTPLSKIEPQVLIEGQDITLVGASYSTKLCYDAAQTVGKMGISAEVIDLRVVNPLKLDRVLKSVSKTGRLLVVDGSWENCGLAGEVIAQICQRMPLEELKCNPQRMTLPSAPAPTSKYLEQQYYPKEKDVVDRVKEMVAGGRKQ